MRDHFDRLAEHAAGRVDLGDRELRAGDRVGIAPKLAGFAAAIGALVVCLIGVDVLDRLYAPGGALHSSTGSMKFLITVTPAIIIAACVGAYLYTSEAVRRLQSVKRRQAKAKTSNIRNSTK
jgi:hypothetical protein